MIEFKIPIGNKGYSLVDEEDYENVIKYKWRLSNGYAISDIKSRPISLHRFILNSKKEDPIVDHINGNKLDNRKSNLRYVTYSQNAQNKFKQQGGSSNYKGVGYHKIAKKWRSRISVNNKEYNFLFEKEEHAAYWYDQLALKYFGLGAKLNNIKKEEDFIEPTKIKKELPKGIRLNKSGTFKSIIKNKKIMYHLGSFKTLEEALNAYNKKKEEFINLENNERLLKKIEKNKEGLAIIKTSKGEEILVDEDKYYDLIKYKWNINNSGYVDTTIDKHIMMHRYLMVDIKENEIIDHINNNRIDNRCSNLRISNRQLNMHNKTKQQNTTSKYIGVCKYKNKYI